MDSVLYPNNVPVGEIQGYADGVPAYSNGFDGFFTGVRNIDERIQTGFQWQCVEFARRWLLERKGLYLPDIMFAAMVFKMTEVEDIRTGNTVPMVAVANGGAAKPEKDTFLIWPDTEDAPPGHIGVIVEVGDDYVRVADQNQHFHHWGGKNYSAELKLAFDAEKNTYTIVDVLDGKEWNPLGWMTFPGVANRDPAVPLEWNAKYKPPRFDRVRLDRKTIVPTNAKENWLNLENAAEKKFVETFGMDVSRSRLNEAAANYYVGNLELMLRCIEAGGVMHRIFLKETEKVINSDELLELFQIPKEFWGRVRKSWATQPHSITGRFDFVVDHSDNLKTFEYNADSASTLLECGRIQQKYAESIGIDADSRSSGFRIESLLRAAWKRTGIKAGERVHFCVDDDEEEQYTALYVMEMATAVGLDCKLCTIFDEFSFSGTDGTIVDKDGIVVKNVWKTWMWESGFADYFKAKEERGEGWTPSPSEKVRLTDILLSPKDDINVFEPMWKVIPSNKAILPMIYDANPDCPFILRASYEVTDELRKTGYATKPIVGRIGENITITGSGGETLHQSEGRFGARTLVYQEKFDLPKRDDYYAILGGWVIGGIAAGVGIREDKSIITGVDSPFSALRFVFSTHNDSELKDEECREEKEQVAHDKEGVAEADGDAVRAAHADE